ncbi:MAG: inositol monophosphatase [Lachnospiraceae bacterium]|nr:inositol monophosphatase [Lachnospiraceae bacterium]
MLQKIIEIVHECGEILLSATDIERKVHEKEGKGNFVTDYDSAVQAILKEKLLKLLPEAVFFGEEDEADKADVSKGYAFIVDPIDGTTNFARGYNTSCISVALAKDGFPVLGVVYNPYERETFTAEKGKGAFLNGKPIHVSNRELKQGVVLVGTAPYNEELAKKTFETIYHYFLRTGDIRCNGSSAINLCNLACGRAELFFELILSPWDYAAGALIVQEAGGIVSDFQGNPLTYDRKQTVVARPPHIEL